MPKHGLPSAWLVVGLLVLALALFSEVVGPPHLPSLDQLIRATVTVPHERLSMT